MQISLPESVTLRCPYCKGSFTLGREYLHERSELHCPLCAKSFAVYQGLTGRLRREIYSALRGFIEARVYEQQQMDEESYFEDRPNLS